MNFKYFYLIILVISIQSLNAQTITVEVRTDQYPSETSWNIKQNGNVIQTSPTGYTSSHTVYTVNIPLSSGTYTFQISDSYGDGICCSYGNGYYKVINSGTVLIEGGNYGQGETKTFTVAGADPCANNTLPTASLSATASSIVLGSSVTLNATASDANGTITKVEFYQGTTKIGEDLTSPYSFVSTPSATGTITYSARAIDNCNGIGNSNNVNVTVTSNPCSGNTVPTVSITQPANSASFTAGSTVNIAANASDANGTVSYVRFFQNGILLVEDNTSPYSHSLVNVTAGTHTISAISFDNCGAQSTQSSVIITVTSSGGGSSCSPWALSCITSGDIYRLGRVGIGNTTFTSDNSYMLYVKGGIKAEKLQMELSGTAWPDYVFNDNYQLLSLHEVSTFIKGNKHLPGVPAQAEIEKNGGIELKEITIIHQKKIEELFLYLLKQNEKIELLERELKNLKK